MFQRVNIVTVSCQKTLNKDCLCLLYLFPHVFVMPIEKRCSALFQSDIFSARYIGQLMCFFLSITYQQQCCFLKKCRSSTSKADRRSLSVRRLLLDLLRPSLPIETLLFLIRCCSSVSFSALCTSKLLAQLYFWKIEPDLLQYFHHVKKRANVDTRRNERCIDSVTDATWFHLSRLPPFTSVSPIKLFYLRSDQLASLRLLKNEYAMIFYTSRQSESVLGFNSNPNRVHEINDNNISFVQRK